MLKVYLEEKRALVEKWLDEILSTSAPFPLGDGMKYAVMNGGKRLRPILHLMALELLGKNYEDGKGLACALEMIHSFSLVHDDLPALDNDDFRRGKLTTHKKYGEAHAILIGDGLVIHAFYVALAHTNGRTEDIKLAVEKLSLDSGIEGMVTGQVLDIEGEKKKLTLEQLQEIHKNKTGKLIRLPIEMACILAGACDAERYALVRYAELIGLAFQIKDDILDVEGTFEQVGKTIGKDEIVEKSTYPSLLGLKESKVILKSTIDQAIKVLAPFGDQARHFIELAKYIATRES
ncbi:MAG: polyprenyl synthetase family protein [Fusobacteria bacterium]|nr:polyprenyl synthetase family protein [Fusobacteriota bacterium]